MTKILVFLGLIGLAVLGAVLPSILRWGHEELQTSLEVLTPPQASPQSTRLDRAFPELNLVKESGGPFWGNHKG